MPRPQFSLKSLLWLMAVVAALFGGMAIQRQLDKPSFRLTQGHNWGDGTIHWTEKMVTRDGTTWERSWFEPHESPDTQPARSATK
jgi:hypothetical protein